MNGTCGTSDTGGAGASGTIEVTPGKVEGFSDSWPLRRYDWLKQLKSFDRRFKGNIGQICEYLQDYDETERTSRDEVKALLKFLADEDGRASMPFHYCNDYSGYDTQNWYVHTKVRSTSVSGLGLR